MVFLPGDNSAGYYSIKIKEGQVDSAMDLLESSYRRHFMDKPFDYYFLDDRFNALYKKNKDFAVVFLLFTIIAIWISSLGLFAMVKHSTDRKTKEIGIRKVVGASVLNVIGMLLWEFLKLVLYAIIIALPISWLVMSRWLEHFAEKVTLHWLIFTAAGALVLLISSFTVVLQSASAATANPTKSLRTE
jgi:putative ABC transport system permease protein